MRTRRALRFVLPVAGWVAAVTSALGLLGSYLPVRVPAFLALVGGGRPAMLLAAVAIAFAVATRRGHLTRVAVSALGLWLALGLSLTLDGRSRTAEAGAHPISVASANVLYLNERPQEMYRSLAELDTDVLITAETTPKVVASLTTTLPAGYQLAGTGRTTQSTSVALWTRLPIVATEPVDLGTRELIAATVLAGTQPVVIVAVHTQSPTSAEDAVDWTNELDRLAGWVSQQTLPVVLAGDFNAALQHHPMRPLLEHASDAAAASGRPFVGTWPASQGVLAPVGVPVLTLDHVLFSEQLSATRFRTFTIPGSDHLGVSADLLVNRAPTQ